MNELFPIADMALALYDEETSSLHYIFGEEGENEDLCNRMDAVLKKNWYRGRMKLPGIIFR